FEQLQGRLEEFRKAAVAGGLEAVVALATPPLPLAPTPDTAKKDEKKDEPKPEIRKGIRATRTALGDARLNEEAIRTALVEAAAGFDPLAPYGNPDAEKGTLALAAPKHLTVGV